MALWQGRSRAPKPNAGGTLAGPGPFTNTPPPAAPGPFTNAPPLAGTPGVAPPLVRQPGQGNGMSPGGAPGGAMTLIPGPGGTWSIDGGATFLKMQDVLAAMAAQYASSGQGNGVSPGHGPGAAPVVPPGQGNGNMPPSGPGLGAPPSGVTNTPPMAQNPLTTPPPSLAGPSPFTNTPPRYGAQSRLAMDPSAPPRLGDLGAGR